MGRGEGEGRRGGEGDNPRNGDPLLMVKREKGQRIKKVKSKTNR